MGSDSAWSRLTVLGGGAEGGELIGVTTQAYRQFAQRHNILLTEQEAGINAFYLPVDDGSVLGRFNLHNITEATATLGYRVADHTAGRGVATATV